MQYPDSLFLLLHAFYIKNTVNLQAARALSRKDRAQNERYVFLSMNRFWPEKRLDIIIEAAC